VGSEMCIRDSNWIVPREEAGAGVGLFMMIFFIGGAAGVAACVTTVELLAKTAFALPVPFDPEGSRYAIALLGLSAFCILAIAVAPFLPNTGVREAREEAARTTLECDSRASEAPSV